ncbi:MAG: UDP-N-acetylglucosamine 2-epimerase (non-hydrolyzing) [Verrucomicrobiota bacterium]
MKPKVAVIAGTRPECVKMAPVYFELKRREEVETVFLATAQHRQMLDQALEVFGIEPEYDLNLMQPGQTLPSLTSAVLGAVTSWIEQERPDALLVQGDTTTVLSSTLAGFYAGVPVGHVEAGLRTGNILSPWPEEMNRRLTSPLATWNFCPTERSLENLVREGHPRERCHVTGNTVVDALLKTRDAVRKAEEADDDFAARIGIPPQFFARFIESPQSRWVLVTGHRRESFGKGFEEICQALQLLTKEYPDMGILYPVHLNPKVQEPVRRILSGNDQVALVEPVSYADFVRLMDGCTFLLSDSGGVQEEAPSLGKPLLVMRETTERPEGVDAGTSVLVGTDPGRILKEVHRLLDDEAEFQRRSSLRNPFGDGHAAERIADHLIGSLS